MFEFIGIAVVVWVIFSIIRGVIRAKGSRTSKEYGLEARRIATNELGVPTSFYNFITLNHMENVKETALMLREKEDTKNTSWPRLLALSIYAFFYLDCKEFLNDNKTKQKLLFDLKITPEVIAEIASQDPAEIRKNHK